MGEATEAEYVRRVLARFRGLRPTRDGWVGCCPCPDHGRDGDGDQDASLHITVGDDGRVLLKCRVGCITDDVLDNAGLDWSDLFPPEAGIEPAPAGPAPGPQVGAGRPANRPDPGKRPARADADTAHKVYDALLDQLPLADDHLANLAGRGLPPDQIALRKYRSLRNLDRGRAARAVHQQLGDAIFGVPGFTTSAFGVTVAGTSTGILVPVRDLQGRIQALKVRRAGEPKYLYLTGDENGHSPGCPAHVPLGTAGPAKVVRVTEGELKADVCTALDAMPTIGVAGVAQWPSALPILRALEAVTVVMAFDAPDLRKKPPVLEQAEAFYAQLVAEGFDVEMEDWDGIP